MQRVLPWIAVVFAAAIAVVAIFEIDMRSEEEKTMAEPTSVPSPTNLQTPETMGPTQPPAIPAQPTNAPPATTAPSTPSPRQTEPPTPEPTEAPATAIPTSTPAGTLEPMPHTGGGAVGGGLALIGIASTLGLALRRSY
jgi:hypothetical protein